MVARTILAVSIAALCLSGCGDTATTPTGTAGTTPTTAVVASVTDGDTVRVRIGGGTTRAVRLLGVDAPEVRHPDQAEECYGDEATRIAGELMPVGASVRLVADPTQDRIDRYGRLLAYVHRRGATVSVNETLVARGAATVYVYRDRPFTRHAAFVAAESEARKARRGLWAACRS